MSVHSSKGLEFDYVFIIGCGRSFPLLEAMSERAAARLCSNHTR